jgi:hypothetical protein
MSSKNLKFIDRLRSKSFDKAIITGNNLSSYHYIENFDNVTEEECLRIDTQNKEIYKKNMGLYEQISKQIQNRNAMFKIDSPPLPPTEPNNYDRFIASRLRNVSRNVRYQSYAIQYLINKGYKLIFEQKEKSEKGDTEFESYEAIDICEKIEGLNVDNLIKRDYPNSIHPNSNQIATYRKSVHMQNVLPAGCVPVYPQPQPPNEQYSYHINNNNHNHNHNQGQHTMYNNYSYSNPNLSTSVSTSTLSSSPSNGINGYPIVNSHNQTAISTPSSPSTKHSSVISGPPASHYMHNN